MKILPTRIQISAGNQPNITPARMGPTIGPAAAIAEKCWLTISNQRVVEEINRVLASDGSNSAVPNSHRYRMDLIGMALRWSLEPPYRIKAPTTLIWGEDDRLVPPGYARQFQDGIGNARVELVPNAGHMVQYEARDAVVDHIERAAQGGGA